jgi:hypothetical protein
MPDRITTLTRNDHSPCLLTERQEVWCWGSDSAGGLGLLTGNPREPQLLPVTGSAVAFESSPLLVLNDGGLWQLGGAYPRYRLDGGSPFVRLGTNFLGPAVASRSVFVSSDASMLCGLSESGDAWCIDHVGALTEYGPASAVLDGWWRQWPVRDLAVLRPGGELVMRDGGVVLRDVVRATHGCAALRDGGVTCMLEPSWNVPAELRPVELGEVPLQLTGERGSWCALMAGDRVRCWSELHDSDAGISPAVDITGVASGVRQVAGAQSAGCVLVGANLVQCWGRNPATGEFSGSTVFPLVFDEPLASIAHGDSDACALAVSGRVWCWGDNGSGQLGFPPARTDTPIKMTR